jgi:phosphate uptake regulator
MISTRRIQVVGNRSYAVSLPKKWIKENSLDKNRVVDISQSGNKLIISKNQFHKGKNTKIIDISDLKLIPSIIILCYTKGVDELTLRFSSTDMLLESKPIVLDILSHLDGFKVSEENGHNIVITSFYNKTDITILKISKRMVSIINQMIECIASNNKKTKIILENEMDCLYHLSKRILYICSMDYNTMLENNMTDMEDIFLWRLIFKKMENIADVIEKTSEIKQVNQKEVNILISNLNNLFIMEKKIDYNSISHLENMSITSKDLGKIKNLILDVLNNMLLLRLNHLYFKEERS